MPQTSSPELVKGEGQVKELKAHIMRVENSRRNLKVAAEAMESREVTARGCIAVCIPRGCRGDKANRESLEL